MTTSTSWLHIWIPTTDYETNLRGGKDESFSNEIEKVHKTSCAISPNNLDKLKSETKVFLVTKTSSDDLLQNYPDNENENENNDKSSVPIIEFTSFEESLNELLTLIEIINYTSVYSHNNKFKLISFQVKDENTEDTLIKLRDRGIGVDENTSVSVVPASISILPKRPDEKELSEKINRFYSSVKSRLLVAEVVSRIRSGGKFTFDYFMLVILAGIIAFMGLLENSSVVLVASMLVSPIMGPILAGIFGTVIQDYRLTLQGIRNELISLLLCLLIGFLFGFIFTFLIYYDIYQVQQWPTKEMINRGLLHGLFSGILIAIPSGAGVALSVLGGNAGSLVGVAISASLLPPAVNAGLFWSMAIISSLTNTSNYQFIFKGWDSSWSNLNCSDTTVAAKSFLISPADENHFKFYYSCDVSIEILLYGVVSLTLTILNIICIIITGIAILKLKEVTPDKIPQTFSNFWKEDIKAHRNYYKTFKRGDGDNFYQELVKDNEEKAESDKLRGTFIHDIFEQAHNDADFINITRWIAYPPVPERFEEDTNFNKDIESLPVIRNRSKSYTSRTRIGKSPINLKKQISQN